jgi:hypothetical protein
MMMGEGAQVSGDVTAAVIAAGVALAGTGASVGIALRASRDAIGAQEASRRAADDLAGLNHRLDTERDKESALRDYQYEARKRLYAECQPLLFQAVLLAEDASHRVASLWGATERADVRPDGFGWLDPEHIGYYFTSTVYFLLVPMTVARLLYRRLTSVDVALDADIQRQYELWKVIYLSFTGDFDLAHSERLSDDLKREYDPDRADPGQPDRARMLRERPEVYARQGLYRAVVENVADALIVDSHEGSRPKTYGEFCADWNADSSKISELKGELISLFGGFHPSRKPVLWRVLVAQYLLYAELLRPAADPRAGPQLAHVEWLRSSDGNEPDPTVRAAWSYVEPKLSDIRNRVEARPNRS